MRRRAVEKGCDEMGKMGRVVVIVVVYSGGEDSRLVGPGLRDAAS